MTGSDNMMNVARGLTSLSIGLLSGWLGVFSLLITSARIMGDILHSGELRAVPRVAFGGPYGFSWRIAFYIGSRPVWIAAEAVLATFGLILFTASILLGFDAISRSKLNR
jgi:hypothetical protein